MRSQYVQLIRLLRDIWHIKLMILFPLLSSCKAFLSACLTTHVGLLLETWDVGSSKQIIIIIIIAFQHFRWREYTLHVELAFTR